MAAAGGGSAAGAGGGEPPFWLLLEQPLRMVLPEPVWPSGARLPGVGPFNYSATAVCAGALALPLAAAGLARCRRDRRWLALAAAAAFAFVAAYHWPLVRTALATVTLLGRVQPSTGCCSASASWERRCSPAPASTNGVGGARQGAWWRAARWCWRAARRRLGAVYRSAWAAHGLLATEAAWTLAAAAGAVLLPLSLRLGRDRRWLLVPLVPALRRRRPRWPRTQRSTRPCGSPISIPRPAPSVSSPARRPAWPAAPARRAAPQRRHGLRAPGRARRRSGEAGLVRSGVCSLRCSDPVYFRPVTDWQSPWLDRLAVRWVVAAPGEPPAAASWRPAYAGPDAVVYERRTALPLVRWGGERRRADIGQGAGGSGGGRERAGPLADLLANGGAPPAAGGGELGGRLARRRWPGGRCRSRKRMGSSWAWSSAPAPASWICSTVPRGCCPAPDCRSWRSPYWRVPRGAGMAQCGRRWGRRGW